MRKRIAVLISSLMILALAACAAGCGESGNNETKESSTAAASSEKSEAAKETLAPSETPAETETKKDEEPEVPETPEPLKAPIQGEGLLGEWYCAHDGVPVCLELKEDGSYTLTVAEAKSEGTWEMFEGDLVLDGNTESSMPVINGERIMWTEAGEIFTREEAAVFIPAPVAAENVELSNFDGYWVSWYVESAGVRLPSSVAGDNSELYIDNGRVAMGGALFGDIICDFTFADSALSYENSAARVTLQLQEDYNLRCTVTGEDGEFIIYMMPGDFMSLPYFTELEEGEEG